MNIYIEPLSFTVGCLASPLLISFVFLVTCIIYSVIKRKKE